MSTVIPFPDRPVRHGVPRTREEAVFARVYDFGISLGLTSGLAMLAVHAAMDVLKDGESGHRAIKAGKDKARALSGPNPPRAA